MADQTIHVLLVDDDAEYVSVAKHYLRGFQNFVFELTWASDGETALEKLSHDHNFDVVLMDYFMPNANGLEVIRKMYDAKITVPTIFLTANKDFRVAVEAMKYGVEEYLVKDEAVELILPRTIVSVLERVNLKKKIEEAEKQKMIAQRRADGIQELIVTMCHEFNNPLAAIKISTDILQRQQIGETEKALLSKLNDNISILEKQIVNLRDFTVQSK